MPSFPAITSESSLHAISQNQLSSPHAEPNRIRTDVHRSLASVREHPAQSRFAVLSSVLNWMGLGACCGLNREASSIRRNSETLHLLDSNQSSPRSSGESNRSTSSYIQLIPYELHQDVVSLTVPKHHPRSTPLPESASTTPLQSPNEGRRFSTESILRVHSARMESSGNNASKASSFTNSLESQIPELDTLRSRDAGHSEGLSGLQQSQHWTNVSHLSIDSNAYVAISREKMEAILTPGQFALMEDYANHNFQWDNELIRGGALTHMQLKYKSIVNKLVKGGLDVKSVIFRGLSDHTIIQQGMVFSDPAPMSCSIEMDCALEMAQQDADNHVPGIVLHIYRATAANTSGASHLPNELEALIVPKEQFLVMDKVFDEENQVYRALLVREGTPAVDLNNLSNLAEATGQCNAKDGGGDTDSSDADSMLMTEDLWASLKGDEGNQ
jgi:hypothetical protein